MKKIKNILASKSPRREHILSQAGFKFSIVHSNVTEISEIKLPPEAFCEHWAREKAKKVAKKYPDHLIIGADTVVVLDNQILGKPKIPEKGEIMLNSLSGRTHEVITGVSFIFNDEMDFTFNETTLVSINSLSSKEISDYIYTYKPYDKAGSYGIQDFFAVHINKIVGCYYNVMGLPISSFYKYYKNIKKKLTVNEKK
tara:strand:- start:258 stop:851 length:594 start_codon:yes stop_codon:yes gene_type:complete